MDKKIEVQEILKGLWPAVDEFLQNNPNWILHERFTNNNGLTILKRINFKVNRILNVHLIQKILEKIIQILKQTTKICNKKIKMQKKN